MEEKAKNFLGRTLSHMSTSDRVKASREAKSLVLGLNEIYKRTKDPSLMEIMKAITVKKRKIENHNTTKEEKKIENHNTTQDQEQPTRGISVLHGTRA